MNTREDEKWQNLLKCAAPTFAGETEPPYGFITGTLARLRSEQKQIAEVERIGWRALLASFAALAITMTITVSVDLENRGPDFEPGVKSAAQLENIQIS
jgi:hypothetical protein